MALIRFARLLPVVLFAGTVGACSGDPEGTAQPGQRSATSPSDGDGVASASGDTPVAGSGLGLVPWVARRGGPTLLEHVTDHARRRAAAPYRAPRRLVTRAVSRLTYAQYRGISFRSERAIWHGESPFEAQLFHPGGGNDTPVRIHVVDHESSHALPFDASLFSYGDELEGIHTALPAEAGYAGFRVLYPLNDPSRKDEVVSFLGASYFRLLGPGHVYGLSSRGLAVDVARPEGEEFPDFVAFWLIRPRPEERVMTVIGLLDGPSVSGAYRFDVAPGRPGREGGNGPTVVTVEARLFARTDAGKLGVAPLTSMYLHGTFDRGRFDDFRPRVHDSEGLLAHTGRGEWIWRPLTNGDGIRLTSLRDVSPSGFGLVQRDRDFGSYMDLEARYHRRPSEWVHVEGDWGPGGVELLEIPTASEFNDNIVASWVPDEPFRAGEARTYRYRLVTFDDRLTDVEVGDGSLEGESLARVIRTRIGRDALPGASPQAGQGRRVVLDFEGGALAALVDTAQVMARATTSSGSIEDLLVHALPGGGRRATFLLEPDGDRGADLRVQLLRGDEVVSETWSYLWEPPRVP